VENKGYGQKPNWPKIDKYGNFTWSIVCLTDLGGLKTWKLWFSLSQLNWESYSWRGKSNNIRANTQLTMIAFHGDSRIRLPFMFRTWKPVLLLPYLFQGYIPQKFRGIGVSSCYFCLYRLKQMAGPAPHTQLDAELAAGMGMPDNGPKLMSMWTLFGSLFLYWILLCSLAMLLQGKCPLMAKLVMPKKKWRYSIVCRS